MKLYVRFGWFFIDIFGFINWFGLALFVDQDTVCLHDLELVRAPGKSMRQILSGVKVIENFIM